MYINNKFDIGDIVYLRKDKEKLPFIVSTITITSEILFLYRVIELTDSISNRRIYVLRENSLVKEEKQKISMKKKYHIKNYLKN